MGFKKHGRAKRALAASAALLAALTAEACLAGTGDDCPPNPEPGKCYEKVYRPAQYESYVDQVRPGYPPVMRQRRIREASFAWEVIPCEPTSARRVGR